MISRHAQNMLKIWAIMNKELFIDHIALQNLPGGP